MLFINVSQMQNKMKVLESSGLNCWKAVMLFKNYKQHVAVELQNITCPEPSEEQWDSYNADTVRNAGKVKMKKQQKRKVELESDKAKQGKILKIIKKQI